MLTCSSEQTSCGTTVHYRIPIQCIKQKHCPFGLVAAQATNIVITGWVLRQARRTWVILPLRLWHHRDSAHHMCTDAFCGQELKSQLPEQEEEELSHLFQPTQG